MKETWKSIKGFEDYYEISNLGNIRGKVRYFRNWKAICKLQSRPRKVWAHSRGYNAIDLWKDNKAHKFYVHRLVAKAFVKNPNHYNEVNHINRHKRDNRASNLEWCTHQYNLGYSAHIRRLERKVG